LGRVREATIALAKLYGTNIYGTASSEAKRDGLREMGCLDVFNSHSTRWYSYLMTPTKGKGLYIVFNSLAGEHFVLCLEALGPSGVDS
jgi:NADPH:quinone reductase-like Zn-dependent oxidoreductase